ncbi:formin-like protein 4 [Salvia hispanica]|uniref:formin-like protein 4 n=1 Tax=Salvia hispanica TaxID=49212 RepID=UPI0020094F91|nr:formin-like protein 4 [Salvia hispanica]
MAATTFLSFFIFLIISHIPESSSQQNIETFYPFSPPPIPSIVPPPPPPDAPISFPPPPGPEVPPPRRTSTKAAVGRAIGVTAASTVVLSALLLFLFVRYNSRRKREENPPASAAAAANGSAARGSFRRYGGNVKGLIVDENGLDVLYWRNMQEGENQNQNQNQGGYRKQNFKSLKEEQQEEEKRVVSERERERKSKPPVQELPLLRGKSSTSQSLIWAEEKHDRIVEKAPSFAVKVEKQLLQNGPPPPPLPPPPRLSAPPPVVAVGAIAKKSPAPPPPPPPIPANIGPPPPPPNKRSSSAGESSSEKVKLKPLHWDKVNPNVEHSMVWDKIDKGSFKFDGDLMEALFGSVAVNRRSPRGGGDTNQPPSPLSNKSGPPSQIFLLDTRRSQNTAIVLKSLALSRKEIIDALHEGHGLSSDTIEKLAAIAPTSDEASQITAFDGDPTRLADAESFLYHLLKSVPTAFSRFHAMLFRSNYDSEVLSIKASLYALESACKELRTRGLFLKLLEAVLKAGNRLNAGTSRGNAQAFNLTALRKLSDVKSSDGKTTLLQFVVQEVVRAEGKRCVLNRNRSLNNNNNNDNNNAASKEDRERDYMMLGLPVIGGLSAEFSNVKKAAALDHDALAKSIDALADQLSETRNALRQCGGGEGGFAREMSGFLDTAELEMRVVREEEASAMELVKKTTDYYQAGSSKDKGANPFQLFVIVKDFLGMVDQVCIEIARNVQKRRSAPPSVEGSSSPARVFRFPKLPPNFMSDNSKSGGSSDSDTD